MSYEIDEDGNKYFYERELIEEYNEEHDDNKSEAFSEPFYR